MKNIKKISLVCLLFTFILGFNTINHAAPSEKNIMNLEGPTVIIDLGDYGSGELKKDSDGIYSRNIITYTSVGATAVSCVLSGHTGGIPNLYEIYIRWTGTNQVANIQATCLNVKSTNILNPSTYFSRSFLISAGSQYSGYKPIGTCVIPTSVKTVKITTTGLQLFFNDRTTWLSTGNLNGNVNVN